jgi:hypothetical protein
MTFILRWPAILALLALVLLCALGALGAAGLITGFEAPAVGIEQVDTQVANAQSAAAGSGAVDAGWIDVGLLAAAAVFFLISSIRLMRRTQGFWTWLLGFACYGGRWAWAQQQGDANVLATLQGIDINAYMQPQTVVSNLGSTEAQVGLLAIVVVVGLFILIVDAADRAYWDKQGA